MKAVYFVREQIQALFFLCSICDRSASVTCSAKSIRTPYRSAALIQENMVDLSSNQSDSILVGNMWENFERKKVIHLQLKTSKLPQAAACLAFRPPPQHVIAMWQCV